MDNSSIYMRKHHKCKLKYPRMPILVNGTTLQQKIWQQMELFEEPKALLKITAEKTNWWRLTWRKRDLTKKHKNYYKAYVCEFKDQKQVTKLVGQTRTEKEHLNSKYSINFVFSFFLFFLVKENIVLIWSQHSREEREKQWWLVLISITKFLGKGVPNEIIKKLI